MSNNSDATEAIQDIIEAIEEYGSTIRIATETESGYDPYTGATYSTTYEDTKAIISSLATQRVQEAFQNISKIEGVISAYDLSIKLYTTTELTKANKIVYDGNTYEITFISDKILQDTRIIYELLIKK